MPAPTAVEVWLDAPISRHLPPWVQTQFGVKCRHVIGIGLANSEDPDIFAAARAAGVCIITKDRDFAALQLRLGPPPFLVLINCGNASNAALKALLSAQLPGALDRIVAGAPIVEIGIRR